MSAACPSTAVVDRLVVACERIGRHYVHEAQTGDDRRVEWRDGQTPQVFTLRRVQNCPETINVEGYDLRCTFGERRHSTHETAFTPVRGKTIRPVKWTTQ